MVLDLWAHKLVTSVYVKTLEIPFDWNNGLVTEIFLEDLEQKTITYSCG